MWIYSVYTSRSNLLFILRFIAGGQLGLWVGISIITLMEVVELIIELSKLLTSTYTSIPRNDVTVMPSMNKGNNVHNSTSLHRRSSPPPRGTHLPLTQKSNNSRYLSDPYDTHHTRLWREAPTHTQRRPSVRVRHSTSYLERMQDIPRVISLRPLQEVSLTALGFSTSPVTDGSNNTLIQNTTFSTDGAPNGKSCKHNTNNNLTMPS